MGKPAPKGAPAGAKGKEQVSSAPVIEKCTAQACKSNGIRFGFCDEHFEQYKFGLINKKGQQVPDYEKKFEHYKAYQQRAHKVA